MANADVKRGLVPVRMASGSVYNGACNKYYVPATNATPLYQGDPVILTGDADARGIAGVARSTATGALTGVIVGFEPISERQTLGYLPTATEGYVLVADDRGLECEVQVDAAITSAVVGLNAGFTVVDGDPVYRRSLVVVDGASAAVTATLPVQIIGAAQREDNDAFDAGGFAKILVRLNNTTSGEEQVGV